jgi:hypothetical protein
MRYHQAVIDCYPGFFASRLNYDVAQGTVNARCAWRSGVLEQSWRLGGASGAELAALEHFHADPSAWSVHASTHEAYGPARWPRPVPSSTTTAPTAASGRSPNTPC